ncbi:MAG TPA: hypothetical protein VJA86_02795 [Candidatus Nanoarchaeia archaeon]|nr:hypothetical protein [Candidatus Nanoarchaeia archaeon]
MPDNLNNFDSKTHREVIEDICECRERYCTLKEILMQTGLGSSQLEQIKCIEKFKYDESAKENMDIGWDLAAKRWVDEGYAQIFDEVYMEGMKCNEIYRLVREAMGNKIVSITPKSP